MRKFEEFTLRNTPVSDKAMRVSLLRRGYFSINKAAHDALGNPKTIALLYDRETKAVGFKPVNEDVRHAYAIRTQNNSKSHLVAAISFCKYYDIDTSKTRVFEPYIEDGILVFDLDKAIDVTQRASKRNGKAGEAAKVVEPELVFK